MSHQKMNIVEQHVEKVVVGLAVVAVVGVLVWQFAGPPSQVQITPNRSVDLADAYAELERKANEVRGQIEAPLSDEDLPPEDMALGLLDRAASPSEVSVVPSRTLVATFGASSIPGGRLPDDSGGPSHEPHPFAVVEVPQTSRPIAGRVMGTFHPQELINVPELAQFVPSQTRPDFAAISVESTFSAAELVRRLESDPDGDGPIEPMPRAWWDDAMTILAVELVREELTEDGNWTNLTVISELPGRFSLMPDLKDGVAEDDELLQLMRTAQEYSTRIRRPRFYQLWFGDDWVPPSEMEPDLGVPVQDPEIERRLAALDDVRRRIARVEKEIERLGGQAPDPRGRPGPGGRGGHGEPDRQEPSTSDRRLENLRKRLEELREEESEIISALQQLGATGIPGVENMPTQMQPDQMASEEEADPPLLLDDDVRLWSHDLTVERGKTYRYRMRVWVNNPMFGRAAGLIDEQKSLADQPALVSADSAWSEPITVDKDVYYFVTSAQEAGRLVTTPKAVATVGVFWYGYYRTGSTQLEPGDVIATTIRVPDFTPWVDLLTREPEEQPGFPGRDDPRGPHGPGHGQPLPPGQGDQPEQPGEDVPEFDFQDLEFEREVVLLDVASDVQDAADSIAYFREEDGQIAEKDPRRVRSDLSYLRVLASADKGEEFLRSPHLPGRAPAEEAIPEPGMREPPPGAPGGPPPPTGPGRGGGGSGG